MLLYIGHEVHKQLQSRKDSSVPIKIDATLTTLKPLWVCIYIIDINIKFILGRMVEDCIRMGCLNRSKRSFFERLEKLWNFTMLE